MATIIVIYHLFKVKLGIFNLNISDLVFVSLHPLCCFTVLSSLRCGAYDGVMKGNGSGEYIHKVVFMYMYVAVYCRDEGRYCRAVDVSEGVYICSVRFTGKVAKLRM